MRDDDHVILRAVVGSVAYGLDRSGSDVDHLGVFVSPTLEVAGLNWNRHRETYVTTEPDSTLHEVGKFCRLALKGNPSITELLWAEKYLDQTIPGHWLIQARYSFRSSHAIETAYGGYARAQALKLARRGDGTFSADTRNRTAKHGRHMLRLLRQGRELLETGRLTLRVPDPQSYWDFDDMTPDQMLDVYGREDALFRVAAESTKLPRKPHLGRVRGLLEDIRREFL